MNKTGWPPPALAQDDDRKLFRWFASKLDARRRVREACEDIEFLRAETAPTAALKAVAARLLAIPFAVLAALLALTWFA
jgi:hypothetical protein